MSLEHSQFDSGDSRSRQSDEVNRRKPLSRKWKRKKGADATRKKLKRKKKPQFREKKECDKKRKAARRSHDREKE